MTKPVPLEALLRRMSRIAEQAFDHDGEIDSTWVVESASGEQQMIVSPIVAPNALAAHEYKDWLDAKMREMLRDLDVVRYAKAVECWTLDDLFERNLTEEQAGLLYAALGYTLANHPDRREVVLIEAEDGTEFLTASREIIRPPHGKPYLGKLGAIERPTGVSGRFLGLLPSKAHAQAAKEASPASDLLPRIRSSRELPDDAGRVFVTNVSNAPIQVMGRRDPATGELCVSGALPPNFEGLAELPSYVEIVTGPEAERLILAVHRSLTERANAENLTLEEFARKYGQGANG
jgi:hypothetical protein